jgi:hypothetical protein
MEAGTVIGTMLGSAVIAAIVSGIIAVVGVVVNRATAIRVNTKRLQADRDLAENRFAFDKEIAERKFAFDSRLAERKFRYDRELHDHKRRVEMAETILADFYECADVVRAIRSPGSRRDEATGRKRSQDESEEESRDRDIYFIPLARIKENSKFISNLMSKRHRSRAVLGDKIDEAFGSVHEGIIRVQAAAITLGNMTRRDKAAREGNIELVDRCEADIWQGLRDNDPIQPMIDHAIEIAEAVCFPILEGSQRRGDA